MACRAPELRLPVSIIRWVLMCLWSVDTLDHLDPRLSGTFGWICNLT